jgi:hypothetical protein
VVELVYGLLGLTQDAFLLLEVVGDDLLNLVFLWSSTLEFILPRSEVYPILLLLVLIIRHVFI